MERVIYKTPAEYDYYQLDYSNSLSGDQIDTSTWADSDGTITLTNPTFTNLLTQIWVGGGTVGTNNLTNTVTSYEGRKLVNSIQMNVQQYNMIPMLNVQQVNTQIADYTIDWQARLPNGDSVATSVWAASDPVLNISSESPTISTDLTSTTVWITGGVTGTTYWVTNTITTAQGRTLQATFLVIIIAQSLSTEQ
jgi:hypothetical protein